MGMPLAIRHPAHPGAAGSLSPRELEILRYLTDGYTNEEIAERLACATATVKTHLQNLFRKMDVHDRVSAAVAALRRVLGDRAQNTRATCACVPALRPHSTTRSKRSVGRPDRCAHAWNGRGGETETAGAATHQVKVCDPRNPCYSVARRLAVGEFIPPTCVAIAELP